MGEGEGDFSVYKVMGLTLREGLELPPSKKMFDRWGRLGVRGRGLSLPSPRRRATDDGCLVLGSVKLSVSNKTSRQVMGVWV